MNVYVENNSKAYKLFLDSIDDLSVARLNAIDMVFNVFKYRIADEGFELSELDCVSPTVTIKRNQLGFYVDETASLNSKEDYRNYLYGKKIFNRYREDFHRINQLLIDKEKIMSGNYKIKMGEKDDLHALAKSLGYCAVREGLLYEREPRHPSEEFIRVQGLLELCNSKEVHDFRPIIENCLHTLRRCFTKNIELKIKRLKDKYDMTFDNTYGIMTIDKQYGEMGMLYYFDGMKVIKNSYQKYIDQNNPYLEIYMRIILKCLKQEEMKKREKND